MSVEPANFFFNKWKSWQIQDSIAANEAGVLDMCSVPSLSQEQLETDNVAAIYLKPCRGYTWTGEE